MIDQIANPQNYGLTLSTTSGATLTSGGYNTYGSYVQLVSSSSYDTKWVLLTISNASGAGYFVDLAIGASGSEQTLISAIPLTSAGANETASYMFPLAIKAGTRIASRCLANQAGSITCSVSLTGFDSTWSFGDAASAYDVYGGGHSYPGGTEIDAPGTANTKTSFIQMVASTSYDLQGFFLGYDTQGAAFTSSFNVLLDIALGASGSEQVILPNVATNWVSVDHAYQPQSTPFFPIPIKAGSRISTRAQFSSAASQWIDVQLFGLRL